MSWGAIPYMRQLEVLTQTPFANLAIVTSPQTLILVINAKVFMQALREDPLYTQIY